MLPWRPSTLHPLPSPLSHSTIPHSHPRSLSLSLSLQVFRGDARALAVGVAEARTQFRKNAAERNPARIKAMVGDAKDAASFLRQSVVQGKMNQDGRYEVKVREGMAEEGTNAVRIQDAGTAATVGKKASSPGGGGGCGPECGCGSGGSG